MSKFIQDMIERR